MNYDVADWDDAVAVLREADAVAIACHVNPDGDAMGSLLGVSLGLRKLGKTTYVTWGTAPLAVPITYAFLPGSDTIVQPADVPETPVFLALDCGAADRLGDVEPLARKATHLINVDHHPGNDNFGTRNLVVTTASSTAELVAQLLYDLDVEI
ncbi:MAG: DHH family phosphoesterase, partial [Actinomycetota bacterium]